MLGRAITCIGVALALGACGSSSSGPPSKPHGSTAAPAKHTKLDTPRVAIAITQSIKAQKHLKATVICPPNVPQQKGYSFTCVATTYSSVHHKRVPVHTLFSVSQTNDLGDVYYQSPQ